MYVSYLVFTYVSSTIPVILFSRGVPVVTLAFFAAIQNPVQKLLDDTHSEQVELFCLPIVS